MGSVVISDEAVEAAARVVADELVGPGNPVMDADMTVARDVITAALPFLGAKRETNIEVIRQAIWQALDDMGAEGKSVCGAAKALLRVAYEHVRDPDLDDPDYLLSSALAVLTGVGMDPVLPTPPEIAAAIRQGGKDND